MSWLVGQVLASIAAAVAALWIVDRITSAVRDGVVTPVARFGVFVGTWTAVTTGLGLMAFKNRVRGWRQRNRDASSRLDKRR